jgi:hypothetical protein
MAPLNLTNVSSAITDEAKDPPMRTITIKCEQTLFHNLATNGGRILFSCDRRLTCVGPHPLSAQDGSEG